MDLLLRELIKDEKKQDKQLYSSGKYRSRKNLKTINQIKKKN